MKTTEKQTNQQRTGKTQREDTSDLITEAVASSNCCKWVNSHGKFSLAVLALAVSSCYSAGSLLQLDERDHVAAPGAALFYANPPPLGDRWACLCKMVMFTLLLSVCSMML